MKIYRVHHIVHWDNWRVVPGKVVDEYHLTKRAAMRACKAIAEDLFDDFDGYEESEWYGGRKPKLCVKKMKNGCGYVVMECFFSIKGRRRYYVKNEIRFEVLDLKLWGR